MNDATYIYLLLLISALFLCYVVVHTINVRENLTNFEKRASEATTVEEIETVRVELFDYRNTTGCHPLYDGQYRSILIYIDHRLALLKA